MTSATLATPDVSRLSGRVTSAETLRQTLLMAGRALTKMRRHPEQFFDVVIQPLIFVPMFATVFGGAISGDVQAYLPTLIPGILVQTVLTTCMQTGVTLREDMEKGVTDRFRSLPMSRAAALTGPAVADGLRYVVATILTFAMGIAIGYRPGGGVLGVLGAGLVAVLAAWSLAWIFTFLATVLKSSQGLLGASLMVLFPLTFLSNAYVDVGTLPGWLQPFARANPVSQIVGALRSLANDGEVNGQVLGALVACLILVAVFMPLAVMRYRRHE